jgi:hypothetical protein
MTRYGLKRIGRRHRDRPPTLLVAGLVTAESLRSVTPLTRRTMKRVPASTVSARGYEGPLGSLVPGGPVGEGPGGFLELSCIGPPGPTFFFVDGLKPPGKRQFQGGFGGPTFALIGVGPKRTRPSTGFDLPVEGFFCR